MQTNRHHPRTLAPSSHSRHLYSTFATSNTHPLSFFILLLPRLSLPCPALPCLALPCQPAALVRRRDEHYSPACIRALESPLPMIRTKSPNITRQAHSPCDICPRLWPKVHSDIVCVV